MCTWVAIWDIINIVKYWFQDGYFLRKYISQKKVLTHYFLSKIFWDMPSRHQASAHGLYYLWCQKMAHLIVWNIKNPCKSLGILEPQQSRWTGLLSRVINSQFTPLSKKTSISKVIITNLFDFIPYFGRSDNFTG